jgi:hypothetical protein
MCDEKDALMGGWEFRIASLCSACLPASTPPQSTPSKSRLEKLPVREEHSASS